MSKINPTFGNLGKLKTKKNQNDEVPNNSIVISHGEIFNRLLEQIEPLDFESLVYPETSQLKKKIKDNPKSEKIEDFIKAINKNKIAVKHYLIVCIEYLLKIAKKNHWGLCKNNDFIYLFNGAFWEEIEPDRFQSFLGKAAQNMGISKYTAKYYQFKEQLYKQFLSEAYLPSPDSNNDLVLVNLMNGTFEITPQKTKLRNFKRSDFITYQLPFEYDKNAESPTFFKYLNRVLPDEECQKVLAEYIGYIFIKHGNKTLKEEKALILYGTGANGKSVFFEILNALLGEENFSSYSLQSITNESGYHRAKLANKLVNYASEINGNLEASIFKQMVSGEPVEARLPYGQPLILRQYAKLIFNCNDLPKDVEHTNAYFRRFLIIPFNVTIPEKEQDKNLHTKIIENELSGVFNWVLEGLKRLLEQKHFSDCKAAQQALKQYKTESNSINIFLEESEYQKSSEKYLRIKELYPEYKEFCIEDGMRPFSKRNFSKQLKELGFHLERESGTGQNIVYIKKNGNKKSL